MLFSEMIARAPQKAHECCHDMDSHGLPSSLQFFSIIQALHSEGCCLFNIACVLGHLQEDYQGEEVQLDDMIWANKLAKANRSAGEMLRKARRVAANPDMPEGGLDDFLNQLDLGDPDPSNHVVDGFNTVEEIVSWFKQDKTDDWRQRD